MADPSTTTIVAIEPSDGPGAVATLERAFEADPLMRWFWPGDDGYHASFGRLVGVLAGRSFDEGTAFTDGAGRAVALWLPPGLGVDDEALVQVMVETVRPALLGELAEFGAQIDHHHPTAAHWYLPFMGVDPPVQGRGLGSALLRHVLARSDEEGLPAYLEASTARNRALYERVGFRVLGELQAGSSPCVWAMLREPRAPGR